MNINKNMNKKWLKYSILSIFILVLVALILTIGLPIDQAFRIVFGSVYLLFIPGFVWSWVFWKKDQLDTIERFTLSLALSIAIIPLVIFLLNKVGVKINLVNSVLETLGVIAVGIMILFLGNVFKNKKSSNIT